MNVQPSTSVVPTVDEAVYGNMPVLFNVPDLPIAPQPITGTFN